MLKFPLVSVLVTVYNRESYLAVCLDSILASGFHDFEVVVVDDQSQDGSARIAEDYAARDPRIRFYRNEKNLGDYPNRNRAAQLARGKYLKYVDADDMLYSHSLELMVKQMEMNPGAALGLSWKVVDPPKPFSFTTPPHEVVKLHFLGHSLMGGGPSGAIIRRECFDAVGGFSGRQFVGDIELWLRLVEIWPLISLPPALVWWRQHEGQQIRQEVSNPAVMASRLRCDVDAIDRTKHLTPPEKQIARKKIRHIYARLLWSLAFKDCRPLLALRIARKGGLSPQDLARALLRRPRYGKIIHEKVGY